MSKQVREKKKEAREEREKQQAKRVLIGIAIGALVLLGLMLVCYSAI